LILAGSEEKREQKLKF